MKKPEIFLKHILESAGEIKKYTKGVSRDKFFQNTQIQDAVVRRLEIIGEAVKNLPRSFRNKYPNIPWKKMAGIRDILIHEYFGVDLKLVWIIANKDIPELGDDVLKILKEIENNHGQSLFS